MTDPILGQRLDNLKGWQSSWQERLPALQARGIGQDAVRPLIQYDYQRVQQGKAPLSNREAALVVAQLVNGVNPLPTNDDDFSLIDMLFKAPIRDLRDIVTSLPQMPQMMLSEAQQAPAGIQAAMRDLTEGDVAGALGQPGVRMLPGAYVGQQVAEGDWAELAKHPLMAALDVSPYAKRAGLAAAPSVSKALGEGGRFEAVGDMARRAREKAEATGMAGHLSRETMRQAMTAERGAHRDLVRGLAGEGYKWLSNQEIKDTLKKSGLTDAKGAIDEDKSRQFMDWATTQRRAGEAPPVPEWQHAVDLIDRLNEQAVRLGKKSDAVTGVPVAGQEEVYSLLGREGSTIKRLHGITEARMTSAESKANKVRGEADLIHRYAGEYDAAAREVLDDEGALNAARQAEADTAAFLEQTINALRVAAPDFDVAAPAPLRPGEEAWQQGTRFGGRKPGQAVEFTTPPRNVKNVVRYDPELDEYRSVRLDAANEMVAQAKEALDAAQNAWARKRGVWTQAEALSNELWGERTALQQQIDAAEALRATTGADYEGAGRTQYGEMLAEKRDRAAGPRATDEERAQMRTALDDAKRFMRPEAHAELSALVERAIGPERDTASMFAALDLIADRATRKVPQSEAAAERLARQAEHEAAQNALDTYVAQIDAVRAAYGAASDQAAAFEARIPDLKARVDEAAARLADGSLEGAAVTTAPWRQIDSSVRPVQRLLTILDNRLRADQKGLTAVGRADAQALTSIDEAKARIAELDKKIEQVTAIRQDGWALQEEIDTARARMESASRAVDVEYDRLDPYRTGARQAHIRPVGTETLDPREAVLRDIYSTLDKVDQGLIDPADLPHHPTAGLSGPDTLRALARQLEDLGITAPPRKTKVDAWKRYRKGAKQHESIPERAALNRMQKLHRDLIVGEPGSRLGLITSAEEAVRLGNPAEAAKLLRKAARHTDDTAKWFDTKGDSHRAAVLRGQADRLKGVADEVSGNAKFRRKTELYEKKIAQAEARMAEKEKAAREATTKAAKSQKELARAYVDTPPARFGPAIQRKVVERANAEVFVDGDTATDAALARFQMAAGRYEDAARIYAGGDERLAAHHAAEVKRIWDEVQADWIKWRDEGFDPLFVHAVDPKRAQRAARKSILSFETPETPGQIKQRATDLRPYETNIEAILTHQQFEWITKMWTENFLFGSEDVPGLLKPDGSGIGKTGMQVFEKHHDDFLRVARRKGVSLYHADGTLDANVVRNITSEVISPLYMEMSPYNFATWTKPKQQRIRLKSMRDEAGEKYNLLADDTVEVVRADGTVATYPARMYVPRGVYKTLDQMVPRKSGPSAAYKVYDTLLDVFRISVLALSPRFYTYNVLGGMVLLAGRADASILKQFQPAMSIIGKIGDDVNDMPLRLSTGSVMMPEYATRLNSDPGAMAGLLSGVAGGRLLMNTWEKLGVVAEKGFAFNTWVDNLYRSMAFLDEYEKATGTSWIDDTAGGKKRLPVDKQAALDKAIVQANKVLQDWDSMLPWERSVLRNVVPFYGWVRFIMRYALTYPFDHPLRASFVSAVARIELEDEASGLPERFRSVFWLGQPGADGKQLTLNSGGVNPFADVADMFSLAGLVSNLSPAMTAALETMGVDMQNARSSLYPDMTYDPVSGRLIAEGRNPVTTALGSFIPQTDALMAITGATSEMRQLARTNPEAWRAQMFTAMGVPFSPRYRSKTEEITRSVLAKDQAASEDVRRAMRTGDWSEAGDWTRAFIDVDGDGSAEPVNVDALRALIDQIQATQPAG